MADAVTLPFWMAAVLVALAAVAVVDRLLTPSVRWLLRRRVERVLDEVHTRLQIRIQPFKLNRRQALIERLIHDPEIAAEAERFAADNDLPRREVADRVERYAREIVPAFNAYIYFRFGYWLSRRIARALYRVRLGAIDDGALAAVPPDSTVVFVMNHRSNMDYILVSYLAAERTALSYAVGEWARIWPLESLVRSMGAYFVRRRSRNALYRRVLRRYVQTATGAGRHPGSLPRGRSEPRRPAAAAQAGSAGLHDERFRPRRTARHRRRAGGHQLRPGARGPHSAAGSRARSAATARRGRHTRLSVGAT